MSSRYPPSQRNVPVRNRRWDASAGQYSGPPGDWKSHFERLVVTTTQSTFIVYRDGRVFDANDRHREISSAAGSYWIETGQRA